ncbi:MAG: DUF938 domain-containing protein [Gammaproteobacteria bacterium]
MKPYSVACTRNSEPILAVLAEYFARRSRVLEIGSGTGQHAVHFARAMPHLIWQASDRAGNLPGIRQWLKEAGLANTPAPLAFDVNDDIWPVGGYDALFSANTLHIMGWPEVERLFGGIGTLLADDASVVVYGPFNYAGQFTSASNAAFDTSLRAAAPHMGIRDFETVNELAENIDLNLVADIAMPANNRCLIWRRRPSSQPDTAASGR